jgi:hypothetical protein
MTFFFYHKALFYSGLALKSRNPTLIRLRIRTESKTWTGSDLKQNRSGTLQNASTYRMTEMCILRQSLRTFGLLRTLGLLRLAYFLLPLKNMTKYGSYISCYCRITMALTKNLVKETISQLCCKYKIMLLTKMQKDGKEICTGQDKV